MKTILIFILGLCWSFGSLAQLDRPHVPPSPNASALIKHANIEVGYYTGVPQISVPLGEVPGKDITIPISLNYHASGIKVQDVASSVGLGWSMAAGGVITRMVRGVPDGHENYCSDNSNSYYFNSYSLCDGERDIFYYTLPNRSGKMFFDGNNVVRTMPYQDIEVSLSGTLLNGSWVIIDELGYKYYFGEAEAQREKTAYYTGGSSYTFKYEFVSSWYLNKIIAPSGIQVATFTYSTGSDFEYIMYNMQAVKSGTSTSYTTMNTKIVVKQAKYLNAISTQIANAQFAYTSQRLDLTGSWQLNTVWIRDQSGSIRRRFQLNLDYFSGEFGTSDTRLRLSSIQEGVSALQTSHTFKYFELTNANPNRTSVYTDHYGYYNKPTYPNGCYAWNRMPCPGIGEGVSKAPNYDVAKVFTLTEISSQTGGRTDFEYESSEGRGLRAKSISIYAGSQLTAKSSFTYAGAATFNSPKYDYTAHTGDVIWSSTSFRDLYDLNGSNIGYGTVTETFLDGSKIVRNFNNFNLYPDIAPTMNKYYADPPNGTVVNQGSIPQDGLPFPPSTTRFWMRGLPSEVLIYDSQNHLLKRDVMNYTEGATVASVANNAVESTKIVYGSNPKITYMVGRYLLNSKPVTLNSVYSFTYDQNGYVNYVLEKTIYNYHTTHKTLPINILKQVGDGPIERITYRYPSDITNGNGPQPQPLADGIRSMYNAHILKPVETVSWIFDTTESIYKIVGASLSAYTKTSLGFPAIHSTYSLAIAQPINSLNPEVSLTNNQTIFSFDSRYRLLNTYAHNEPNATITSVQNSAGINTQYQWLNNTLISSVVVNPGATQLKKDYLHNSIDGVTQVTDENGRNQTVQYEYNTGRVLRLKDHENNIQARFRYHLKDQNESLKVTQVFNTCAMRGHPITFSSYENTDYGQINYLWDFGDGTTTTTTGDATHTFVNHGTYQVKLRKENPEYYSLNTSTTVNVKRPINLLTGYVDGPSSYDVCALSPPTQPTTLVAQTTGDIITYIWEYSYNGGWWWSMGSGSNPSSGSISSAPPYGFGMPGMVGTWDIRCTVTDACGNQFVTYYALTNYASNPICEQY